MSASPNISRDRSLVITGAARCEYKRSLDAVSNLLASTMQRADALQARVHELESQLAAASRSSLASASTVPDPPSLIAAIQAKRGVPAPTPRPATASATAGPADDPPSLIDAIRAKRGAR